MGWIVGKGIGIPFRMGGGVNWANYWATRTPSTLALTNTGYPEGIKLDWLNAGAGYDGTSIERSADGVTYAEIDTVASGILTYTDATAVFKTLYYYRVRCYKGTNYSPYSNAESLEVTSDRFIITVDTTKVGSANDTFVLPTNGAGYDAFVDWGDGGAEQNIVGTPGNVSHTYASQGTYQIKIRGTFPRINFSNAGDKNKVTYLNNWGNMGWTSFASAFYGCSIMVISAKDTCIMTSVTSCLSAFRSTSLTVFDFTKYDTQTVEIFSDMFRGNTLLKQSFADMSIKSATTLGNFLYITDINNTGTTTNYDATLISFSAQAVAYSKTGLSINFGTAKYGAGLVDSGTTDGVSAGKLIKSGQNFVTTVTVGDVVHNTTDGTYAFVTAIDSDTQLSISADIMASGENYRIQHSDAAKARAQLVIPVVDGGQGWTITDGGYA